MPKAKRAAPVNKGIKEIEDFIRSFLCNWSDYDMEGIKDMVEDDDDAPHIGTDEDEYIVGKSNLLKRIADIRKTDITMMTKVLEQHISLAPGGKAAHFGIKFDTKIFKNDRLIKVVSGVRTTGFIIKKNRKWKLAGSHVSMPVKGRVVNY